MGHKNPKQAEEPFEKLRERRELLISVLGIVRFMEGLQDSLEAVQLLGEHSKGVPRFARLFFGGLENRLAEADSVKLRGYLTALERLVKQDLTRILRVAEADRRAAGRAGDPAPEEPPPEECKLVDDFRRRALTVVSLRILLRKRGESVGAVTLPVPQKLLDETLAQLDQERCAHTERALGEALMLIKDIDVQLQNKKLAESMRKYLEEMRVGLQQNVDHLKAGKPVSELPVPMESSEAGDIDWLAGQKKPLEEEPQEQSQPEEPETTEEIRKQDAEEESDRVRVPQEEVPVKKRSVLARAWTYMTTGPKVGWKDTEGGK